MGKKSQEYINGWNDALKEASTVALAIDSNRGNEKLISETLLSKTMLFEEKETKNVIKYHKISSKRKK